MYVVNKAVNGMHLLSLLAFCSPIVFVIAFGYMFLSVTNNNYLIRIITMQYITITTKQYNNC